LFKNTESGYYYSINCEGNELEYENISEEINRFISENEDKWISSLFDFNNEDDFGEDEVDPETDIIFDNLAEIKFEGSIFVLSGDFEFGSKSEVSEQIVGLGGAVTGSVSGKTNYLVIGNNESANWTNGAAGGKKVEKALELKEKGNLIFIVSEGSIVNHFR
jgi:NAD-dependent DNA ligase